jgi:hypothetical protein
MLPATLNGLTESSGDAPKSNKQKEDEAARIRLYQQQQWQNRKAAEKKKREEADKAEREKRKQDEAREKYIKDITEATILFSGAESQVELARYFNALGEPSEQILRDLRARNAIFVETWIQAHPDYEQRYVYILENDNGARIQQSIDSRLRLSEEEKTSLGYALRSPDIAAFLDWHIKRSNHVESVIPPVIDQQYLEIKKAKKDKLYDTLTFWRGASLGLGVYGEAKEGIPNTNLYADLNILFWSFLRMGPYVTAKTNAIPRYGILTEFVIGSPRLALLLGVRTGYALEAAGPNYKPTVSPSAGLEFSLGLPVSLVFKYEYEIRFLDRTQYQYDHQFNLVTRFRHYNDYYFSRGEIDHNQVDGPFWKSNKSGRSLASSFSVEASALLGASKAANQGLYEVGVKFAKRSQTGIQLNYGLATDGENLGHFPNIGIEFVPESFGDSMKFRLTSGTIIRPDMNSADRFSTVIWPQLAFHHKGDYMDTSLLVGYFIYVGRGVEYSAWHNQLTLGLLFNFGG